MEMGIIKVIYEYLPGIVKSDPKNKRLVEMWDREWNVFECSAQTGEGVLEGMKWLVEAAERWKEKEKS